MRASAHSGCCQIPYMNKSTACLRRFKRIQPTRIKAGAYTDVHDRPYAAQAIERMTFHWLDATAAPSFFLSRTVALAPPPRRHAPCSGFRRGIGSLSRAFHRIKARRVGPTPRAAHPLVPGRAPCFVFFANAFSGIATPAFTFRKFIKNVSKLLRSGNKSGLWRVLWLGAKGFTACFPA
jgi:hypothetical protein